MDFIYFGREEPHIPRTVFRRNPFTEKDLHMKKAAVGGAAYPIPRSRCTSYFVPIVVSTCCDRPCCPLLSETSWAFLLKPVACRLKCFLLSILSYHWPACGSSSHSAVLTGQKYPNGTHGRHAYSNSIRKIPNAPRKREPLGAFLPFIVGIFISCYPTPKRLLRAPSLWTNFGIVLLPPYSGCVYD